MTPAIEVRGLSYSYDDKTQALAGVSFSVAPGETVALLGANGSGKTTLLLHLNGLLAGEGSILIGGVPLTPASAPALRSKVGVIFQDSDDQLFMPTVLEDVSFGPLNQGHSAEQAVARARAALLSAGLSGLEHRPPYHLSAGEKRRVALAGVLAMQPDILILDEPTTFLDPPGQRNLAHLLISLPQPKLIATHDVRFAAAVAHRALFLANGTIVADGPVSELAERFDWDWSGFPPQPHRPSVPPDAR